MSHHHITTTEVLAYMATAVTEIASHFGMGYQVTLTHNIITGYTVIDHNERVYLGDDLGAAVDAYNSVRPKP